MDQFTPQDITLRDIASKLAKLYDPTGITIPYKVYYKNALSKKMKDTSGNYHAILSNQERNDWVQFFHDTIKLQKFLYSRCSFPKNSPKIGPDMLVGYEDYGTSAKN